MDLNNNNDNKDEEQKKEVVSYSYRELDRIGVKHGYFQSSNSRSYMNYRKIWENYNEYLEKINKEIENKEEDLKNKKRGKWRNNESIVLSDILDIEKVELFLNDCFEKNNDDAKRKGANALMFVIKCHHDIRSDDKEAVDRIEILKEYENMKRKWCQFYKQKNNVDVNDKSNTEEYKNNNDANNKDENNEIALVINDNTTNSAIESSNTNQLTESDPNPKFLFSGFVSFPTMNDNTRFSKILEHNKELDQEQINPRIRFSKICEQILQERKQYCKQLDNYMEQLKKELLECRNKRKKFMEDTDYIALKKKRNDQFLFLLQQDMDDILSFD